MNFLPQIKKFLKSQSGVSLIEMLIAVTIFSVTVLSATGIFKIVLDGQRNAVAGQNVQENMRYVFETIGKEIRMARRSDKECEASGIYKVFNTTTSDSVLHFKNKSGKCVVYYLDNNRLLVDRGTQSAFVTPDEIKINNLKFMVVDDLIDSFHSIQPMVTIVMDVEAVSKEMHKQNMKIQLTISSRYYE